MDLVEYAKTFLGIPYIWGGADPSKGLDCSGFVQEVLKKFNFDPPGDQSAQGLYYKLSSLKGIRSQLGTGSVLFFGLNRAHLSHVSIAISDKEMIEAGGGNSSTTTIEEAKKIGACVRIKPISRRKDLVAVLKLPLEGVGHANA